RIGLYLSGRALAVIASGAPSVDDDGRACVGHSKADSSKIIAIGTTLTAGFADGGLCFEGQQTAFPVITATQMKTVGGGDFQAPYFDEAHANGSGYIRLKELVNGSPVMESVTDKLAYRTVEGDKLIKYSGEIHNLGVPGMRLDHAGVNIIGAVNMYFERL